MNLDFDIKELIIKNIFNYLKKKNISYNTLLKRLYQNFPHEKIDSFFNKENTDVEVLIKISDILNENIDYFCFPHIEDEKLSIEQEKLLELMEVCNQDFDISSVNVRDKLLALTKYALDNELTTMSKASYYLNCSISKIYKI